MLCRVQARKKNRVHVRLALDKKVLALYDLEAIWTRRVVVCETRKKIHRWGHVQLLLQDGGSGAYIPQGEGIYDRGGSPVL